MKNRKKYPYDSAKEKLRYEKRRAEADKNGTCFAHTGLKLVDGKCPSCVENKEKRKVAAKIKGTCIEHPDTKLVEGRCPSCIEYQRIYYENEKIEAKEKGTCKNHLDIKLVDERCLICDEEYRQRVKDAEVKGVCFNHPNLGPIVGERCEICFEYRQEYSDDRRAEARKTGMCWIHPEVKAIYGIVCFSCWCGWSAYRSLGSWTLGPIIEDSYIKNGGYDYYTGAKIAPGGKEDFAATFDHTIPESRGGKKEITNGQWTSFLTNRSKSNLTGEEYFNKILEIYLYMKGLHEIPKEIFHDFKQVNTDKTKCGNCKKNVEIGSYCEKHWYEQIAYNARRDNHPKDSSPSSFLQSSLSGVDLKNLFHKQGGICPLTGAKLILGGDNDDTSASLDHILAKSRKGTNDLSNLQFISLRANIIKQTMTNDELFKFCENIIIRFNLLKT